MGVALAPASQSITAPFADGRNTAIPGRSTPASGFNISTLAATKRSPVFPAEMMASARPSLASLTIRAMDESRLPRIASTGESLQHGHDL